MKKKSRNAAGARGSAKRPLKIGDHVRFALGTRDVVAKVVEDYGNIGVRGRQLVSVELETWDGGVERFDVAAEEVSLAG